MSKTYLDNAAFSFPKPAAVAEAVTRAVAEEAGNPGRGVYALARRSENVVTAAREAVAALLGASDPSRVVFTHNATDSLNGAIAGLLRARPGRVVTTPLEHNSVMRPLRAAMRRGECHGLEEVALDAQFHVDLAAFEASVREPGVSLAVVSHASNVLGCAQPLEPLSAACRAAGVPLVVDAAQSAGVLDLPVSSLELDVVAFSGHKALYGPGGVGVLYVRQGLQIEPWREGGTGGHASEADEQPSEMPWRLEAGTMNVVGIAGLLAGVQWVQKAGLPAVRQQHTRLARRLLSQLVVQPHVRVLNPAPEVGLVSFTVDGWEPTEVARVLADSFDIAVGAGLSCAPAAHRHVGTLQAGGAVRASFGLHNTDQDVDVLAAAVERIAAAEVYTP
jgi:cysteine desulfurase family protein